MNIHSHIWANPTAYLTKTKPDRPVHFFCPSILRAQAQKYLDGFPGLVTFAVKSNPDPMVISNLVQSGLQGFDVASPNEIALVAETAPGCAMHYNNPVKSRAEIAYAIERGVNSFALDSVNEFSKLCDLVPASAELSVRFKLPVKGAVYDFGSKFGAKPSDAAKLLKAVAENGYLPSLTFHPGTQCEDPAAWRSYIEAAAKISAEAGITPYRLNVGGGFPCKLGTYSPNLGDYFSVITSAMAHAFPNTKPALICEPGRSMVAECFAHAVRIKGISDSGAIYLNDGIYGGLSEFPVLPIKRAYYFIGPNGEIRDSATKPCTAFGPTCDSVDTLPNPIDVPADMREGDYIVFPSMGAYVKGVTTDFNGYGQIETATILSLR